MVALLCYLVLAGKFKIMAGNATKDDNKDENDAAMLHKTIRRGFN
jgi:hypothetical protein